MDYVVNESIFRQIFDGKLGHLRLAHTGGTKDDDWDVTVRVSLDEKIVYGYRLVADDDTRPLL